MAEPINRTILVTDVEKFSRRVDGDQAVLRRVLYEVVHKTLAAASIDPTEYTTDDRGDGVFALIDAKVPKAQLLRALITVTPSELREYNRRASEVTQLRMRCVVHSGEVALDGRGAIGAAVIDAFRICDSDELKDELAKAAEPSVLCVTDLLYQSLVRHQHPGLVPEHFHPLDAKSKDGHRDGWVYDRSRNHQESAPAEQASPQAAPPPGVAPAAGNSFSGTTLVGGDVVGGNKYVGGGHHG